MSHTVEIFIVVLVVLAAAGWLVRHGWRAVRRRGCGSGCSGCVKNPAESTVLMHDELTQNVPSRHCGCSNCVPGAAGTVLPVVSLAEVAPCERRPETFLVRSDNEASSADA